MTHSIMGAEKPSLIILDEVDGTTEGDGKVNLKKCFLHFVYKREVSTLFSTIYTREKRSSIMNYSKERRKKQVLLNFICIINFAIHSDQKNRRKLRRRS